MATANPSAGPGAPKGSDANQLFAALFRARSCSKAVLKMLYRHGFPPPVEAIHGARARAGPSHELPGQSEAGSAARA